MLSNKFIIFFIFLTSLGASKNVFSQATQYDFVSNFNQGDKFVYEFVETKYKKNNNGHFLYVSYDTTYFLFDVETKTDSNTILNFKHVDYYTNGVGELDEINKYNLLRSENYQILLDKNGAFLQLLNWENFARILIQNLKVSYSRNEIDSNTLKYYYLYYHKEINVEKTVLGKFFDLFAIYGEKYTSGTSYTIAKELLNPFGGNNLLKSGNFDIFLTNSIRNSVFFKGTVKSDIDDLEALQSDYYEYFSNKKQIFEVPNIYLIDQFEYQYGLINQIVLKFNHVHDVYIDNETQGVDKKYTLIEYKR